MSGDILLSQLRFFYNLLIAWYDACTVSALYSISSMITW